MATYNGEKWISHQLTSIIGQIGVSVDLSITDDISSDNTATIVMDAVNALECSNFIQNKKSSGSAGGNFRCIFKNVNVDGYDYVALADQDDIWNNGKIFQAIKNIKLNNADGYSCSASAFWSNGKEKLLKQNNNIRSADQLFEGAGQGCTFVMQRQFFQDIQNFCRKYPNEVEELHYHDWLIYLLARAWSKKWYFDQIPWIQYRQHSSNEIGARGSWLALQHRLGLIRNGWYKRQIQAASRIYILANGQDPGALKLASSYFYQKGLKRPFPQRLSLALQVLRHSRRSLSDRLILVMSALAGWI